MRTCQGDCDFSDPKYAARELPSLVQNQNLTIQNTLPLNQCFYSLNKRGRRWSSDIHWQFLGKYHSEKCITAQWWSDWLSVTGPLGLTRSRERRLLWLHSLCGPFVTGRALGCPPAHHLSYEINWYHYRIFHFCWKITEGIIQTTTSR